MDLPVKKKRNRPISAGVIRAREALQKHADTAARLMVQAAKVQAKRGGHTAAAWILEHTAAVDEQGKEIRPIAPGIDRQQLESGSRAPTINIGWIAPAPPRVEVTEVVEVKQLPEGGEDS